MGRSANAKLCDVRAFALGLIAGAEIHPTDHDSSARNRIGRHLLTIVAFPPDAEYFISETEEKPARREPPVHGEGEGGE